jgi:triacylglycerol lipase
MPTLPLKPIPNRLLEWKELIPPNYRYDYFAAAGVAAFQPRAAGFCAINATCLADASLLAYAPPDFALEQFRRVWPGDPQFFEHAGTRAYLIEADEVTIAAFRGTEVDHPKQFLVDLADDFSFAMRPGGDVPGRIHGGFAKALDDVWDRIAPPLQRAAARGTPVWLTGHSLGAALATLAGARLGSAQGVYAFASPRVGDGGFAAAPGLANLVRFVFSRDLVPRLPPRQMGFEHGGLRMLISDDGAVAAEPEPARLPDVPRLKDMAGRLLEAARLNLFDHPQVLYATHLWNAYVAGR